MIMCVYKGVQSMKPSVSRAVLAAFSVCLIACSSGASTDAGDRNGDDLSSSDSDLGAKDSGDDAVEPDGGQHEVVAPSDADGGTPDLATQPFQCMDQDGDGYGDNCYLGQDCDDTNPYFNVYCPLCSQKIVEGCKCVEEGAAAVCYEGAPNSAGVGVCQLGERICQEGYWAACQGQILPAPESCDSLDNDCDGLVDDGVLSPCGDCDPACETTGVGPDESKPFTLYPANSENVGLNMDGYLTLETSKVGLSFIWIANSGQNTVSRLDTEECKETGRYKVCGNPSRTSVDQAGNLWVGCRKDGGVAKIAGDESLCVDKNGNGMIDTAEDLNGDGKVNGNEVYPKGQDECVMFVVYPGGVCQRAVGVDQANYAWVGEWNSKKLRRLAPQTGVVVQEISLPNNPFGLVVDPNGIIWVSGRGGGKLVRVDPGTGQVKTYSPNIGCFEPSGINLDYMGRVWVSNCCCWHVGYRFDPETLQWVAAPTQPRPRGMAGSSDGYVYVANDQSHRIAVIDADTAETLGYMDLGGGHLPFGVDVDYNGYVWAINKSASSASKIDPETYQVVCEVPVGGSPETYSDMTGYALHSFTAPEGSYRHFFDSAQGFSSVYVDFETIDPESCYIKVRLRSADDEATLAVTQWQGYFGPFPPDMFPIDLTALPDMGGKKLEVEVSLFRNSETCAPIVKSIQVKPVSAEE